MLKVPTKELAYAIAGMEMGMQGKVDIRRRRGKGGCGPDSAAA